MRVPITLVLALLALGCAPQGGDRAPREDPPGLIGPPPPCVPGTGDDLDGDGHTDCTDCNDADPAIHPDAEEIWYDGVDGDCDGAPDHDADADGDNAESGGGGDCDDTDPGLHSLDHDDDGVSPCGGDCDDSAPHIHAGAERICGDGVDNDCDGYGDCEPIGVVHLPDGVAVEIAADDAIGLGHQLSYGDVTGDGQVDVLASTTRIPGRTYAFDPTQADLGGSDDAVASAPGWVLWAVGDVTGDGTEDLSVLYNQLFGDDPLHIYEGPLSGDYDADDAAVVAHVAWGGHGPLVVGDLDGDGISDLVAQTDGAQAQFGVPSSWVIWMASGPLEDGAGPEAINAVLYHEQEPGYLAPTEGRDDVTGDGQADLLVSDGWHDTAFIVPGDTVVGTLAIQDVGHEVSDVGWITAAGDVDGDGYDDVATHTSEGLLWTHLLFGPVTAGADPSMDYDIAVRNVPATANTPGDHDGDGHADLMVQTTKNLTLLYGPIPTGRIDPKDQDHAVRWPFADPDAGGGAWVPLDDLDGDGTDDMAFAMVVDEPADSTALFLVFGAPTGL